MIYCIGIIMYFKGNFKMLKKILAFMLVLIICIGAAGCSGDGAPDGMKLASIEGEPFKLYVPEAWTSNGVSGISGAFYAGTDNIAVSARYYALNDTETDLDSYVNDCISKYTKTHKDFDFDGEVGATVLGGVDAREIVFNAEYDKKDFTFRQIFSMYLGDVIVLSFRCPEELFDNYNEQFTQMADVFELCERSEPKNDCVTDKKTPEGMKIASHDNIEYRFYVPTTWVCDSESGTSMAYFDESGRPNVTVTSYIPDDVMTAEEYFELCEEKYEKELSGYELLDTEEREVAGRTAVSYTYCASYDGTKFFIMQTVLVYNDRAYSITYTAPEDLFDGHTEDVEKMLDEFKFR